MIFTLIRTQPDEALPYLLPLADSPDAKIRENAAWTLAVVKPRVDAKLAEKLAMDEDADVRASALGAVAHFKGQAWAFETLVKALDDPVRNVRVWAAINLGHFNDKRAIDILSKYLNGSELQRYAQDSIKQLQSSGKD